MSSVLPRKGLEILREIIQNNEQFFDSSHEGIGMGLINDTIDEVTRGVRIVADYVCETKPTVVGDSHSMEQTVVFMLNNCAADLYSAIFSLRQGFFRTAGLAIRGALENLLIAAAINSDSTLYFKFTCGRFTSTDAFICLKSKREYSDLVKLWGGLSGWYVHEGFNNVGRGLFPEGDTFHLTMIPILGIETVESNDQMLKIALDVLLQVSLATKIFFPRAFDLSGA